MGPWEMSLAADTIFPNAKKVVTPFIHPGHWGEDEHSVAWFSSREDVVALTRQDGRSYREAGISCDRIWICPVPADQVPTSSHGIRPPDRNTVAFLGVDRGLQGRRRLPRCRL